MQWKNYIWVGLIALIGTSCAEKEKAENEKLTIVTTTGMIADAVKNITGDKADVIALMGPGVDPHLYKASQGDIEKLRSADIVFYNGLHLEGKMQEIFASLAKEKPVFAVSDGINKERLLKLHTEGDKILYDPHIWFDVGLWQEATHFMLQQLIQTDGANAESYIASGTAYLDSLNQLQAYVMYTLQTIPPTNRILITSHDAFEYFGRAYISVRVA
ncbi:MAG: metal ABC transporter solute-binding protein, Zn/Mn family, partial [Chitinophagales bacterium]